MRNGTPLNGAEAGAERSDPTMVARAGPPGGRGIRGMPLGTTPLLLP